MGKKSAYAEAGVNIDAAKEAVRRMEKHIQSTFTASTLSGVGPFGGMFDVSFLKHFKHPVLVSSIDGVGTKIIVAETMDKWTIGRDIVNHCVNDVLTTGAIPLFFLDYIAAAQLKPEIMEKIVAEMAKACREVGIPLISGETAEMSVVYQEGRHDVVGCVVGVVEKDEIVDGSRITAGDVLLGLLSNGLGTNGFSLARKAFKGYQFDIPPVPELDGRSVGEELLRVHKCYYKMVAPLLQSNNDTVEIHGIAHITGGGLLDNIARLLPKGTCAEINKQWPIPPVFRLIQGIENVSKKEMRRVFNLGIGMVLIVRAEDVGIIKKVLMGDRPITIGEIKKTRSKAKNQKVVFTY